MHQSDNNKLLKMLLPHQKEAIETTINQFNNGVNRVLLHLDVGTGRTAVIVEIIRICFERGIIHKALILTEARSISDQFTHILRRDLSYQITNTPNIMNDYQIAVFTYSKLQKQVSIDISRYDLIVCIDAERTNNKNTAKILENSESFIVGIVSSIENQRPGWLTGQQLGFSYSMKDVTAYNYLNLPMNSRTYHKALADFCKRLLTQYGYDVEIDPKFDKYVRPDMLIASNEQEMILEVKAYRERYISKNVIDNAITQILKYKYFFESAESTRFYKYCLVLFCQIDSQLKETLSNQNGINIWDISNLLYLCSDKPELSKELSELIYFPIADIDPEEPRDFEPMSSTLARIEENSAQSNAESLEELLRYCKKGKKAAINYEQICTEIIQFIFDGEFTQISNQHKTKDELFRMDLLCGIKGESQFWRLLMQHYNTRFVVFEYKNYSDDLPQNLIYITEKYLFNAALRNVAIIISRKGFSSSARIAALGCLKESGKLIMDLTDDDLIVMLKKKADGEIASDHLLFKLEELLMSVSK